MKIPVDIRVRSHSRRESTTLNIELNPTEIRSAEGISGAFPDARKRGISSAMNWRASGVFLNPS